MVFRIVEGDGIHRMGKYSDVLCCYPEGVRIEMLYRICGITCQNIFLDCLHLACSISADRQLSNCLGKRYHATTMLLFFVSGA